VAFRRAGGVPPPSQRSLGAGQRVPKRISDAGDSGSLIVDDQMLAAALLFAGGDHGGSNGKGLTYANPIAAVLKALKVKLA
jgi:hypothetical protein